MSDTDGDAFKARLAAEEARKLGSEADDVSEAGDGDGSVHSAAPSGRTRQRRPGFYDVLSSDGSVERLVPGEEPLWIDMAVVETSRREDRLGSEATAMTGLESGGSRLSSAATAMTGLESGRSRLSSARHSSVEDDSKESEADEAAGVFAAPSAGVGVESGASAPAGSPRCSVVPTADVRLEVREEDAPRVGGSRVELLGQRADYDGKEDEEVSVVATASRFRRGGAGHSGCGAGAGSSDGADGMQTVLEAMDTPDEECAEALFPSHAGRKKGEAIYASYAQRANVLLEFVFHCEGRKHESPESFKRLVSRRHLSAFADEKWGNALSERYQQKFITYWAFAQIGITHNMKNPFLEGVARGVHRAGDIFEKIGDPAERQALCDRFLQKCVECIKGNLEREEASKLLLFLVGAKCMFAFTCYENAYSEGRNYFKEGIAAGADPVYGDFCEKMSEYCDIPIAHFRRNSHSRSRAMLQYWRGFKEALEAEKERTRSVVALLPATETAGES